MFRQWSAIFDVGAAVRRRVWTEVVPGRPIYPNLFVWLVGPPGTGKTEAIVPATEHLRKSDTCRIAPNDVTKQSLLDRLAKAADSVSFEGPPPTIIDFHYFAVMIRELSNFMNQYDSALAGILTDLFDNPPVNEESKRGRDGGESVAIIRPGMSFLAGTATKNLGATISGDLWGQGFMSRVIMIYSADKPRVRFSQTGEATQPELIDVELVQGLGAIGEMKGRVYWSDEAFDMYQAWFDNDMQPVPLHAKLVEYNSRRYLHVAKLALISCLSDLRFRIETWDFERGKFWLEQAELAMPEIFKEMTVHKDGDTLRELHMHLWSIYSKQKAPIPNVVLAGFLSRKVASRDVARLIETGEASGLWERMAATSGFNARWVPKIPPDMSVFDTE